jgi:hypothetical protein
MSENMFAWYLKERILEAKQTLTHVNDMSKKSITKDKIELLSAQRVRPKSKQLGVTWLVYLVTPS